jgi:hypothetical protein
MPIDQEKNIMLKEMWRLDEKDKRGEKLTMEEKSFWNNNLKEIQQYYLSMDNYWHFNFLKNQL